MKKYIAIKTKFTCKTVVESRDRYFQGSTPVSEEVAEQLLFLQKRTQDVENVYQEFLKPVTKYCDDFKERKRAKK